MAGAKWTVDELAYLMRGESPPTRTDAAVRHKRKRLGLDEQAPARDPQTTYTKHELAQRLGVTFNKVVYWRGKGWLTGSLADGQWTYARSAVRRFLKGRGKTTLDLARVDREWFIEILAGTDKRERAG